MDDAEQPAAVVPTSVVGKVWLPVEYVAFGLGLGALLAAAGVVGSVPLWLVAVSLAVGEGLSGLGVPLWREWMVAGLAVGAVGAALLHARSTGLQVATRDSPTVYPHLRVALAAGLLAAGAVAVAGHRFVLPPGPEGDGLALFHGAGVPSALVAAAALLALVGGAGIVFWSVRRSLRLERDWWAAGAPRQPALWRPSQPPRRVPAMLLGAGLAVLLVPAGWPLASMARAQAVERMRSHVVSAEAFDPPLQDPEVLAAGVPGQSWVRQDLQRAVPAGDLVVGLTVEQTGEDRIESSVLGLRADDGAQLWQWRIRSRVRDMVVDPEGRAVLVLLSSTVVVLDFEGQVSVTEILPRGAQPRSWSVVEQPTGLDSLASSRRPPNRLELARTVVIQAHEGTDLYPSEILGMAVATGATRWRATVPPRCETQAVVVPESLTQSIGVDMLVSFEGSLCRTHDHLTRFGPDGPGWSSSLAPAETVLRTCYCRLLGFRALAPDLVAAVVLRDVSEEHPGSDVEVVVIDGDGDRLAVLPRGWLIGHTYLVTPSQAGAGPVVATKEPGRWVLSDLGSQPPADPEVRRAPGLDGLDPLAVAWPLLVEHRETDTLVVWDASDGLEIIEKISLPPGPGCHPSAGRLQAYGGHATLTCLDDDGPRATVVTLPPI